MRRISANAEQTVWRIRFVRRAIPALAAAACLSAPDFALAQSGWKWFGNKPPVQVQAPKPQNGFAASVQRLMEQARQEAAAGNTDAALQTAQRAHKIAEAASSVLGNDPSCSPAVTRKFVEDIATLGGGHIAPSMAQVPVTSPPRIAPQQRSMSATRPMSVAAVPAQPRIVVSATPAAPQILEFPDPSTEPASRPLPAFVSAPQPVIALLPPTSVGAELPTSIDSAPLRSNTMLRSNTITSIPRPAVEDPYSVAARIQPYLTLPEFSIVGGSESMTDASAPTESPVELTFDVPQVPPVRNILATSAAPATASYAQNKSESVFLTESLSIVSTSTSDTSEFAVAEEAFNAPLVPGVDGSDDAAMQPISEFTAMQIVTDGPTQLTSQAAEVTDFPMDNALLQHNQPAAVVQDLTSSTDTHVPQKQTPPLPTEIPWDSNATEWSSGQPSTTSPVQQPSRWVDTTWQPKQHSRSSATESEAVPRVPPVRTPAVQDTPADDQTAIPQNFERSQPVAAAVSPSEIVDLGVVTTAFVTANQPVGLVPSREPTKSEAQSLVPAPPAEADADWLNPQAAWMQSVPPTAPTARDTASKPAAVPFDFVQSLAQRWNVPTQTVATLLGGGGLLLVGCGMLLARAIRRPGT